VRIRLAALAVLALLCSSCGDAKKHPQARLRRVPNVVGLSLGSALDELGRADLCVKAIRPGSTTVPAETVLSQTPKAGAPMKPYGRVSIVVSPSGPSGPIPSYTIRGCRDAVEYDIDPG
jgi:beta-lactam-binding protein with PASTA domain